MRLTMKKLFSGSKTNLNSAYMKLSIIDTQHNNAVPLCWVSRFICCYDECHYAECRYSLCHYAKCRGTKCHFNRHF